ncbi:hypothetical protein [Delftia sp.]|uniref:hypothetical protein n=1 Tax=Delftia sp. TaxID=1886637 RepID=UPI00259CFFED|nr:hypothetical protein [Delftia sp.]
MSTPAKQHPDRPDAAGFVRAALAAALAQVQSHLAVLEPGGGQRCRDHSPAARGPAAPAHRAA